MKFEHADTADFFAAQPALTPEEREARKRQLAESITVGKFWLGKNGLSKCCQCGAVIKTEDHRKHLFSGECVPIGGSA